MFEAAGFTDISETDSKVGGVPRVVMRRTIEGSAPG